MCPTQALRMNELFAVVQTQASLVWIWKFSLFGKTKKQKTSPPFFPLENSVEKMQTVRWELPHHAMAKSICSLFYNLFPFFSVMPPIRGQSLHLYSRIPSTLTLCVCVCVWDPKHSYTVCVWSQALLHRVYVCVCDPKHSYTVCVCDSKHSYIVCMCVCVYVCVCDPKHSYIVRV